VKLQRARVHRVLLETSDHPIRSPRTGAEMTIVTVPEAGGESVLTIKRVVKPGRRRVPEHVHLGFSERFTILRGIADARIAGSEQRLAAGDTLWVGIGRPHSNPSNRDTSDLVYLQTFTPATDGARSYVRTLAQVLRDGRDDDGELPGSVVLAIGDVTRERTYAHVRPYSLQRRVLLPLGNLVAGTRGFTVHLARQPRKAAGPAGGPSAKRSGEVGRTP
jgi:mannose-6-phosphate isomerase-like protein (cupin superfamily)